VNGKGCAKDKDLALRSGNEVCALDDSLDNTIPLNSLGDDLADDTLKELDGAASRERLASAGGVDGKTRAELGVKGCHGWSMHDSLDVFLAVDVTSMAQSTVHGELYEFPVTEEVCCTE